MPFCIASLVHIQSFASCSTACFVGGILEHSSCDYHVLIIFLTLENRLLECVVTIVSTTHVKVLCESSTYTKNPNELTILGHACCMCTVFLIKSCIAIEADRATIMYCHKQTLNNNHLKFHVPINLATTLVYTHKQHRGIQEASQRM